MNCQNIILCVNCYHRTPISPLYIPTPIRPQIDPMLPRFDPIFPPRIEPIFPPTIEPIFPPTYSNCNICLGTKYIRCPGIALPNSKLCSSCLQNLKLCWESSN